MTAQQSIDSEQALIDLPDALIPVFTGKKRYRGAYGGRGSGKTFGFALMAAIKGYEFGEAGRSGSIVCARQFQNSIADSSMDEVKKAIRKHQWLEDYYEIGETFIRSRNGRITFRFRGLERNLDSIKSESGILVLWVDEAESVSKRAWDKVRPTVRAAESEIWVTWNPESADSATDEFFRAKTPPNSSIVKMNYYDNPWFPEELEQERLYDQEFNVDTYDHIWHGDYLTSTEAQVFHGKWEIKSFNEEGLGFAHRGLDFGFSQSPLAASLSYISDQTLYIAHEFHERRIELDHTIDRVNEEIPGFWNGVVYADSAEPKSISYLKRNGAKYIKPTPKQGGSIEEGIRWMRSLKKVVIHPRCVHTAREFRVYSHKVDRKTGTVLDALNPVNDHIIDSLRYALSPLISSTSVYDLKGML